jgi:hypothetical protein
MTSLKDKIDAKMEQKAKEVADAKHVAVELSSDPDLDAAKARVKAGELAAAYRTRNGALVITHKSDPQNSPAAPQATSA